MQVMQFQDWFAILGLVCILVSASTTSKSIVGQPSSKAVVYWQLSQSLSTGPKKFWRFTNHLKSGITLVRIGPQGFLYYSWKIILVSFLSQFWRFKLSGKVLQHFYQISVSQLLAPSLMTHFIKWLRSAIFKEVEQRNWYKEKLFYLSPINFTFYHKKTYLLLRKYLDTLLPFSYKLL